MIAQMVIELTPPPGICHDVLLSLNLFQTVVNNFYRAMHVVLVRYCYRVSSVRPSVCLYVTLRYREHRPIGWTSKVKK